MTEEAIRLELAQLTLLLNAGGLPSLSKEFRKSIKEKINLLYLELQKYEQ